MQKLQDRQKWLKDQPIVYLLSILNGDEMDLKTAVMGDDNPANLMADTGRKKHGIADTPTNRRLRELYSFLNSVRVEQKAKQKNRTCGPLTFVGKLSDYGRISLAGRDNRPFGPSGMGY